MKKRLLLTGANGFVGSALVPLAAQRYKLTGISRARRSTDTIVWDFTTQPSPLLPSVDLVIHMASLTAKGKNDSISFEEYKKQNVVATSHLLQAFSNTPSYMLYVSTADVYEQGTGEDITEQTRRNPQTPYAKSKAEAEDVVASFCSRRGIPYGIARLGLLYGPGEGAYKKVIPEWIRMGLAGNPLIVFGSGNAMRQYLYIDDAIRALLLLINRRERGVVNVVGKTRVTMKTLASIIHEVMGNSVEVSRSKLHYVREDHIVFDTARLAALGFEERVSLREGLMREVAWFKKQ